MSTEIHTLVVYDIEVDKVRAKVADVCKDYGLERIQMSAFLGKLDRAMRRELFARLADLLGATPGKVMLLPICEPDFESRMEKEVEGDVADGDGS